MKLGLMIGATCGFTLMGMVGSAAAREGCEAGEKICEHSKLFTQDADPLGKGAWQIQFNAATSQAVQQWDTSGSAASRGRSYERGSDMALTFGATDKMDVAMDLGYLWLGDDDSGLQPGSGLSDLALSAKWRFYENEKGEFALAFLPTLTVPTGSKTTSIDLGPGQEAWSLDTRFAIVKDWDGGVSANGDLGYETVLGNLGNSRGNLGANLAVSYHLFSRFQPELELNYGRDLVAGGADADLLAATIGAEMPLSGLVCIRTGAQFGVIGSDADQVTTFALSIDLNL